MTERAVLVVAHTARPAALAAARRVSDALVSSGVGVRVLEDEARALGITGADTRPRNAEAADGAELVLVFGGDGTLLSAAEVARPAGAPLLGINLGHIGFLAEAEKDDLDAVITDVLEHDYDVEERLTVEACVLVDDNVIAREWALNEASVEKLARERLLEVVAEIDGRPLSRFDGDGVICATPTGSTAYAFSAGGPIIEPTVEAMLFVPISAHALFSRPLVVPPTSCIAIELLARTPAGVLWCDGRRAVELPPGARVEVRRGELPVRLAMLHVRTFVDRLVAKFQLPVRGWRGLST